MGPQASDIQAAMMADAMLEKGDIEGQRVLVAVDELQSGEAPEGVAIH